MYKKKIIQNDAFYKLVKKIVRNELIDRLIQISYNCVNYVTLEIT